jgi:hypothetical protein
VALQGQIGPWPMWRHPLGRKGLESNARGLYWNATIGDKGRNGTPCQERHYTPKILMWQAMAWNTP